MEALRERTGCEPVHWYAQPLDVRVSALAFGRRGRRCVVLSGGLLALRNRRPETFEAVVLHELAHVRNRDIDLSFLTIVSARVSLPVLVLTLASGVLWELLHGLGGTGSLAAGVSNSLQGLCLVVAMPLTRRAVLRSREFYADARARQWAGSASALRALFEVKEDRRRLPGRLLRVHPTARQRRDMLDDPEPLFRSGFWELLAAGCDLGALYTDLATTFVLNSALGPGAETARSVLAVGTLGLLLAAVAAFFTLRLQEGFPGGRPGLLGAPVWGLACGLALGGGVVNPGVTFALASVGQVGAGLLPWTALLALGGYAAVRWTAAVLPWWRPVLRGPRARAGWCVLSVAAGALFGCVLVWLMELIVTQALMATLLGGRAPELVSFLLGTASDAVVRSPFLLCAALLAALIPLLGQAAPPGARAARQALGRTVAGALRAGLWLAAALVLLWSGPRPPGVRGGGGAARRPRRQDRPPSAPRRAAVRPRDAGHRPRGRHRPRRRRAAAHPGDTPGRPACGRRPARGQRQRAPGRGRRRLRPDGPPGDARRRVTEPRLAPVRGFSPAFAGALLWGALFDLPRSSRSERCRGASWVHPQERCVSVRPWASLPVPRTSAFPVARSPPP
ncbi:M48 family metalloprotease [Streptomyces sp. L06]|nr:M48 family metalloprotease [Streptomyces sp. L06]